MEMGSGSGASDSLNGLKFGKKIYFEDVGNNGGNTSGSSSKGLNVSMAAPAPAHPPPPPPPSSQKKGKGVSSAGQQQSNQQQQQPPRCQVEGCMVDLTGAKAYYCRHKVCGMHSKSPKVVVAGIEQRFCQQCSRFHQLHEFDQGKRSCRRRLAGHNERRRKPPPGPLSPRYGRLSSSIYEDGSRFRSFLMDFSYPRTQSPPSRNLWPAVRSSERVAGGNQWLGNPAGPCNEIVTHPYIHPSTHYTSELPPSECFAAGVTDSSCALSLLSTQPWGTTSCAAPRSRAPNISASIGQDGTPMGQPIIPSNHCMAHPWGFKNHGAGTSHHEIQHDMGLGHFDDDGNGQFSGELELALQGNRQCPAHGPARAYDHSGHGGHWSL